MILVAATALGCGALTWLVADLSGESPLLGLEDACREFFQQATRSGWAHVGEIGFDLVSTIACLTMPLVAMWTLALIPIRLLGPRRSLRRLARQPGLMATSAVGVATVFAALQYLIGVTVWGWEYSAGMIGTEDTTAIVPALFGLAVLVSWMTLWVGRRWRAEPSWIDRLGRAFGAFWIVIGFAMTAACLEGAYWSNCAVRASALNRPPALQAGGGPNSVRMSAAGESVEPGFQQTPSDDR
jgi:hypothetical protein